MKTKKRKSFISVNITLKKNNFRNIPKALDMPIYRDIHTQFCYSLARVWFIHSQIGIDCWEIVTDLTGHKVLMCTPSVGYIDIYLSGTLQKRYQVGGNINQGVQVML